jgi:hypothetical protein
MPQIALFQISATNTKNICYFKNPIQLFDKCENKNGCSITGTPNFATTFNDPCINLNKLLYLQWQYIV